MSSGPDGGRAAVFLDRDGTINEGAPPHEYITSVADFRWLPGAVDGLVKLARTGYVLTVVSNQRGVARGLVSPQVLTGIEQVIQAELAAHGCRIAAFRYCPHDILEGCDCRKPRPGMLLALADELNLDLGRSWMVGDAASDIEAGRAAGCRTVQIGRSPGQAGADLMASSLREAAELIAGGPPQA